MKTIFSLIYLECEQTTANVINNLIGPELFSSEPAAIDKLFMYVEGRLTNDILDEYVESVECLRNTDNNNVMEYAKQSPENKLSLIKHYFNYMNNDTFKADFSIKELVTSSFIEELKKANALDIDGNYVRYFTVLSADEVVEDNDEVYLEFSFVTDDLEKIECEFSLSDVMNAHYNIKTKAWTVRDHDINLFYFRDHM